MKIQKKYYIIVFLLMLISNVFLSVAVGTKGSSLQALEQKVAVVEAQNRRLQDDLLVNQSLTKLSERVVELGFEPASSIVYVGQNTSLAKLP